MSNVLTIPGIIPAVNPREPNEVLVNTLRELLERAESGEIVGMAAGFMHGDGQSHWTVAGAVGAFSLIGALRMAEHDLIQVTRSLDD